MSGQYTPEQAARVRAIFEEARASKADHVHQAPRRHPAEVTADRLIEHMDRWPDEFDGEARDAVAYVRHILHQIADG